MGGRGEGGKTEKIRISPLECENNNFHKQEPPMKAEISAQKFKQKQEYLHNLKVSPPTYLVIIKEKVHLQRRLPTDTIFTM